jgi:cysteine-S-conjugate beta-lyase
MTQDPPSTSTQLIHHPYRAPDGFAAPQGGVFKASTVIFANVAAMRARDWKHKTGYTYGLHGTPTTFALEARIATLEHGLHCLLVPSGLAAIANVNLALLKTDDEVLIPDNAYGPSLALAEGELAAFGIHHRLFDAMNPADLAAKISDKTKLVWLEAPGSVTMEFPPLAELVRVCKARGVTTALDNTWGAGLAFNAFDFGAGEGVDISIQALTKYPSGGGDVLIGSVVTREEALHIKIKLSHMRLGFGVAANDCEAVLRSLPSIALRYDTHDHAARELAQWLKTRPEVAAVLHPALEGAPGHAHWQALCGKANRAAGLFSIVFKASYTQAQVDKFCDSLQLFKIGHSWGSHLSLVVPYDTPTLRKRAVKPWPGEEWQKGVLVRFSVGLEGVADLRQDLERGLAAL